LGAVWRFEGGTVGPGGVTIKQDTADDPPYGGRISASLSCTIYWKYFAVLIVFFRDAKKRFQLVFAFLQGGSHDECHVFVDAKFSTGDGCKGWKNAVVTRGSIIVWRLTSD
jgi:hypothetical protein